MEVAFPWSRVQELLPRISGHCNSRGLEWVPLTVTFLPPPLCVGNCLTESSAGMEQTWECLLEVLWCLLSSRTGREWPVFLTVTGLYLKLQPPLHVLSLLPP